MTSTSFGVELNPIILRGVLGEGPVLLLLRRTGGSSRQEWSVLVGTPGGKMRGELRGDQMLSLLSSGKHSSGV